MTTTDSLVAKAQNRAAKFAAQARLAGHTVTETVEDDRLMSWSPLTRTFSVEVRDSIGRTTVASWIVPLERAEGRRRSIRFFGWGFSPYEGGKRISEDLARIRISV